MGEWEEREGTASAPVAEDAIHTRTHILHTHTHTHNTYTHTIHTNACVCEKGVRVSEYIEHKRANVVRCSIRLRAR